MLLGFTWAGADAGDGERAIAPLRTAARPDVEIAEPTRWVTWQSAADELFPKGVRAYWKNASLDRLDAAAIATIVEHAARLPAKGSGFDVHHLGGAFARVPGDSTAFPNRAAAYWLNMYGVWRAAADDARGKA